MTCALRALNICDGLVLETDPGALTQCPHEALRHARAHLSPAAVVIAQQRLERLIEEAGQQPLF